MVYAILFHYCHNLLFCIYIPYLYILSFHILLDIKSTTFVFVIHRLGEYERIKFVRKIATKPKNDKKLSLWFAVLNVRMED